MMLPKSLNISPINESGQYMYFGGLQIRGIESNDCQLSLGRYWNGGLALYKLYPRLTKSDIPFAQDCFGDQFFEREGVVHFLAAETGEIKSLNKTPTHFLKWVDQNPIELLNLPENLNLEPGFLLLAYPPFCTKEGKNASIKPIKNDEVIKFHSGFAEKISNIENGKSINIEIIE